MPTTDTTNLEITAYFGGPTAAATFVLAVVSLTLGSYAVVHAGLLIGLVPTGLGLALLIGGVIGIARRRTPTAYVRIGEDCVEWMCNGKKVTVDRHKIVEIYYSDSEVSSFTFHLEDGSNVTCLSGFTPGQEHKVYNFFVRTFSGRLLYNGSEMRRVL